MNDLHTLMERRGWNQSQTAAALGVSRGAVAKWLAGDRNLSTTSLYLIRAYLASPKMQPEHLQTP